MAPSAVETTSTSSATISEASEARISTHRSVLVILVCLVIGVSFGWCLTLETHGDFALSDEFALAAVSYALRCVR